MNRYLPKIALALVCMFFWTRTAFAQSYGLGFNSHEVISDQRTTLDLFPNSSFKPEGNFDLSFDLAFLPNSVDYFGYIFRVIANGKQNIDLVYNNRDVTTANAKRNRFKLVMGERYSDIDFEVTPAQLLDHWNRIEVKFDYQHGELLLAVNGHIFRQKNAFVHKADAYRIIFGVCKEPGFKSSDCSAFKIRNIRLSTGQNDHYHWPLNESSSNTAHETVKGSAAAVSNPDWILADHANWHDEGVLHVKGISSATFNSAEGSIYVVGQDTLWKIAGKFFLPAGIGYDRQTFHLLPSNETIFNPADGKLYNYYIDNTNKKISVYNAESRRWEPNPEFFPAIDFWQTNSFFCKTDTALYVVGGYGRMTYKNTVFRYSLTHKYWEQVKTSGYYYCPRYLTACGTTADGSAAYFLGGYGSHTGEQMLNAKNLYDLVRFDVKTKTFKKIYELPVSGEDFVFASTMVINDKTRTFSALVFSNQHFNSRLRLLQGSLDKPVYRLLGDEIPFSFHDTHSFAKLFYDRAGKKLLAVTMNRPANHDQDSYYHFYSLLYPPVEIPSATAAAPGFAHRDFLWISVALALAAGIFIYVFYLKKHGRKMLTPENTYPIPQPAVQSELQSGVEIQESKADAIKKYPAIYLFGNLTVYNAQGDDLSGQFTSLVRELFLVILIYSMKPARGITAEKLLELLWSDKPDESARNNRSANLSKLRNVLSQISHVSLSKDTGKWRIEVEYDQVYVDYWEYLQIIGQSGPLTTSQNRRLIQITSRGAFITGFDYHWIEQIKTDVANDTIDIYLASLNAVKPEEQPDYVIALANAIFIFDLLNEDAMIAKCRALYALGKHTLARSTFDLFNKKFKEFYGENFKADFLAVVNNLIQVKYP